MDSTTLKGLHANNIRATQEDARETLRLPKIAALVEDKSRITFAAILWTGETSKAPVTYLQEAKFLIKIFRE